MAGGGGATGPGGRKKARIEIIPLIDIMFFLLASFMLVSLSMLKIQGLKVTLPTAKSSAPENKPDFLTLSITKTGDLGIDKDPIRLEDIIPRLTKRLEEDAKLKRETRVYVNADRDTPHFKVVEALDKVRTAKITTANGSLSITKISFAIQAGGPTEPATTVDAPKK